jgi:3D (Asp-Asp-Asp) domain-containing protein
MSYEESHIVTTTSTYDTSSVIESEPITESIEPEEWVEFVATAYCPCEKCCGVWATKRELDDNGNPIVYGATGIILEQGISVAADKTYPMGTSLEIEGMGTYIVHDRGGAIKGNRLDIYFDNHTDALEFGVQTVNVRVTK